MKTSNTKLVIDAVQDRILKEFPPEDYDNKPPSMSFVETIDSIKRSTNGIKTMISTRRAIKEWLNDNIIPYTYNRCVFLNNLGLDKYLAENYDKLNEKQIIEIDNLFIHLFERDGEKLYDRTKKQLEKIR